MAAFEIRPLDEELLPAAAALLRDRHERALAAEPRQGRPASYEQVLRDELARDGATGLVALSRGRAVASLVVRPDRDSRMEAGARERMYADLAGVAAVDAEALRLLYAVHAATFAERGVTRHVLLVPQSDDLVRDVLSDLAFGVQYRWGVRDVAPTPPGPPDVVVRAAEPRDLSALAALDRGLHVLQAGSPSFSGLTIGPVEEFEQEWSDLWDQPDVFTPFVAERDGDVIAELLLYRRPADLRLPGRNVDLAHAATSPEHRRTGAMTTLLSAAMTWAAAEGFVTMTTDWRTVNLLSSRFWTGAGFSPTFVRMYRALP